MKTLLKIMLRDARYRFVCDTTADKTRRDDAARQLNEVLMPWVMAGGRGAWYFARVAWVVHYTLYPVRKFCGVNK